MKLPFQESEDNLLAVLPRGQVEFLDPKAKPLLEAINQGSLDPLAADFSPYIINDPLVEIEGFHLAAPVIVFFEITNLCNLRCKHCYVSSGLRREGEMPTSKILSVLDELEEIGVLQIFLTGGELFAHPDAVKIVKHARSKPFVTQIFTNGLLLSDEKLAQLPAGTSFNISFDTAEPERTVRGGMDFPKLRQCFELMKKHGHVFRTAVSVHRNNIDDVLEIYKWCAENDCPRPQWLETHPLGRALLHPNILLQPEHIDRVIEVYKKCMDLYTPAPADEESQDAQDQAVYSVDTIKFVVRLERATGQEKCARSVAYINASGDVYPCTNCQSSNMFKGGNILERPLKEIWEEGFKEFRDIVFDDFKSCRSCPVSTSGVWCQFRCPPLAKNVSLHPLGCGATEYLKIFMVRAHEYWEQRKREGKRLSLRSARAAAGA